MLIRKIIDELFEQKRQENPLIGTIASGDLKSTDFDAQSPYVNEADISAATVNLVDSARESIILQAYKFMAEKQSSVKLIDALKRVRDRAARNKQTINVYILLNRRIGLAALATGKFSDDSYADQLISLRALAQKDNPYFNLHCCYHEHQTLASYHTKFVVIDGAKMMLRGCDFGENDRLETCSIIENRDMINGVIRHFCEAWNAVDGEKIHPENFIAKKAVIPETTQPNAVLLCKPECSSPFSSHFSPLKIATLLAFKHAKNTIHIIIPNLNDADVINELVAAAARGVKIRIYMGKLHNDFLEAMWGGTNIVSMQTLYDACCHLEQQPDIRWATHQGKLIVDKKIYEMHGKAVIVDGRYVLTGSSALDKQALLNSRETDMVFDLPEIADRFERIFQRNFDVGMPFMSVQQDVVGEINKTLGQLNSLGIFLFKAPAEKYRALELLRERVNTPASVSSNVNDIINAWLKDTAERTQCRLFVNSLLDKYGSKKLCDKAPASAANPRISPKKI